MNAPVVASPIFSGFGESKGGKNLSLRNPQSQIERCFVYHCKKEAIKKGDKKETIKTGKQKNEIILYLTDHTSAKSADIAALLDVKSTRVKKLLSELIAEGAVVAEGSNRNRTYKLKS